MSDQPILRSDKDKGTIELDFLLILKLLFEKRKYLVKVTFVFILLGLFIAIFSSKEYTSSITMVPQVGGDNQKNVGLAGLAAMAGFNINTNNQSDVLPPTIYPKILNNIEFQKELIYTKIKFSNIPEPVSIFDYYSKDEYKPFNILSVIKKYTIGLPGFILKSLKSNSSDKKITSNSNLLEFSKDEYEVASLIMKKIDLNINEKEGVLRLSVNMPEASASTEFALKVKDLLQKYITNFKIDKLKTNLEFVNDRYKEAKLNFERKQGELASFRDANRNVISSVTRTQEERLNAEYSLLYSVYSELAKQLEQTKIKVKDSTPVLTVVEPAYIPNRKSKPNRVLILIGFAFLGVFVGSGIVIIKNLRNNGFTLFNRSA